jgi:hypothetical protein
MFMAVAKIKTLVIAGAAAATMAIGIMPANAVGTWTVSAGSAPTGRSVSFKGTTIGASPQIHFTDVTTSTALTCDAGSAGGTTVVGTGLPSQTLASINGASTTWTNCLGPLGIQLTPTGHGIWKINANKYNATTGVTSGTIVGANATVTGTGCSFTVKGSVPISYTNSTQVLAVKATKANLVVSGVSGCFGAVNNADHASFSGNYKVATINALFNPIQITSP